MHKSRLQEVPNGGLKGRVGKGEAEIERTLRQHALAVEHEGGTPAER